MLLVIIKITVSIITVAALAEVSKKINPIIGGVFNGLPLGSGLSVYFITLENGSDFIIKSIPYGITALASSILFCLTYFIIGRLFDKINNYLSIAFSFIISLCIFSVTGFIIQSIKITLLLSIIIFIASYIINIFIIKLLFKNIEITNNTQSSLYIILLRGIIVSIIILIITAASGFSGSKWAGILSSFPSTLYALIVILHYENKNKLYPSVIYGFSFGVFTLLIFYLSCNFLLPKINLNISFVIIYIICLVFILFYNMLINVIKRKNIF